MKKYQPILLLIPYILLFGCSEPENGDGYAVMPVQDKSVAENSVTDLLPTPLTIKEDRAMSKIERVVKPVVRSLPTYGGYTFDEIVEAIIYVESKGNRKAKGKDTERGLMQVRYKTWLWTCKRLLKKDVPWEWAYHPYWNKLVGRRYLQYCFDSFEGSPTQTWDAIRAYNKGVRGAKLNRGWSYLKKVKRQLRKG